MASRALTQAERLEEINAALESQVSALQQNGLEAAQRHVTQLQQELKTTQDRAAQVRELGVPCVLRQSFEM